MIYTCVFCFQLSYVFQACYEPQCIILESPCESGEHISATFSCQENSRLEKKVEDKSGDRKRSKVIPCDAFGILWSLRLGGV